MAPSDPPPLPPRRDGSEAPPVPPKPYNDRVQQQDLVQDLSHSMDRVTLDAEPTIPFPARSPPKPKSYVSDDQSTQTAAGESDSKIRIKDLTIPAHGDRDCIRNCPYPDGIQYPVRWYYANAAPRFFVCSNCFKKYVSMTKFSGGFSSKISIRGEIMHCNFAAPRSRKLWARTLSSNDFKPFKSFMEHRAHIVPCHGIRGVNGDIPTKWFAPVDQDPEGFLACEACYEDIILATKFSDRFQPYQVMQQSDQIWSCDIAQRYISRALQHYSPTNNWQAFTKAAGHRLKIAPCARYQLVEHSSRRWYIPQPRIPGLSICETCYLDFFALSSMEKHLELDEIKETQKEILCSMGLFSLQAAWDEVFSENKYRLWLENAKIVANSQTCSTDGPTDGTWYTFRNGFENFDLCPSCYSCLIETFGFDGYFKKTSYPTGTRRGCDFHPGHPKFGKWVDKLAEAIFVNDFNLLQDCVVHNANLLPCPRSNLVAGRHWYGTDDFLICGECYEEVVRGTSLDHLLKYHDASATQKQKCDLYSSRMRSLWKNACQDNDLGSFTALARHRNDVYLQTVPVMENMLTQQKISLMKQQSLHSSAMLYKSMDAAASSRIEYGPPTPKYTYGASDVGYGYGSPYGIDAARMQRQSDNLFYSSMMDSGKISLLENRWRGVE